MDSTTKNQIDYILVDKRYRNGIKNSKARPGADCGSDHKPVVAEMCIKLQREVNKKKDMQATSRWNTDILKQEDTRLQFELLTEEKFENAVNSHEDTDTDSLWAEIKSCIQIAAEQVCGKHKREKKTTVDDRGDLTKNGRKKAVPKR